MIRNSLVVAAASLLLSSTTFAQMHPSIKNGLKALTTSAIEGPTLDCDPVTAELSPGFYENGADCSKFVKDDGELGELGTVIVNHIDSMNDTIFYDDNLAGIQTLCPNWATLSQPQKGQFWVWLFAAISWKESTCGAATINRAATHGVAAGLLQLNQARKDRAWRGGDSGKSCGAPSITDHASNLKCGIEILHEQLKGREGLYEGNGQLFGRGANSYWQALRTPDGGKVIDLLETFPFCQK